MHTGRLAAANIRKPLLIAQGANDPRVKQAESDQMVAALRARGIPVTYVLFPDEGHGFARPENAIACNALIEDFLARHLGGEAEPISAEQMAASTAKIIESGYACPTNAANAHRRERTCGPSRPNRVVTQRPPAGCWLTARRCLPPDRV